MLFFFKEKPIEITAIIYPGASYAKEYSPIKLAREFFPEWWRNTPSSSYNWDSRKINNTAKGCPGIGNILKTGFIMPIWSDLALEYNNQGYFYHFADNRSTIVNHVKEETPGFYEDYWHLKFESPWLLKTSVDILVSSPFYLFNKPNFFITPIGINRPMKGFMSTNFFMFLKKELDLKREIIKQNTPLIHYFPLTEKKIKFKIEEVSSEEFERLNYKVSPNINFNNQGLKIMNKTSSK